MQLQAVSRQDCNAIGWIRGHPRAAIKCCGTEDKEWNLDHEISRYFWIIGLEEILLSVAADW